MSIKGAQPIIVFSNDHPEPKTVSRVKTTKNNQKEDENGNQNLSNFYNPVYVLYSQGKTNDVKNPAIAVENPTSIDIIQNRITVGYKLNSNYDNEDNINDGKR